MDESLLSHTTRVPLWIQWSVTSGVLGKTLNTFLWSETKGDLWQGSGLRWRQSEDRLQRPTANWEAHMPLGVAHQHLESFVGPAENHWHLG